MRIYSRMIPPYLDFIRLIFLILFLAVNGPASNWGSAKKCSLHPEGGTGLENFGGEMIPYQFKGEIDEVGFFRFDKRWIENKNWALLPLASKAILPVIGCHCNANGHAFPGERRIAILSGLSDKTVRKGIRGLEALPGFRFESYISSRLKKSKKFFLELPPLEKGRFFPFHKFILESGLWRELSTVAKAIYPVLRAFSWFDIDQYFDSTEDNEHGYDETKKIFEMREFDFFNGDLTYLADYAGIHRNSLKPAMSNLKAELLIEDYEDIDGFRVFLRSKKRTFFKRKYLNDKISNSYRHLNKS